MQEIINYRKRGDSAFRAKDFTTAIHYYTQVIHSSIEVVFLLQLKTLVSCSTYNIALNLIFLYLYEKTGGHLCFSTLCSSLRLEPWSCLLCSLDAACVT